MKLNLCFILAILWYIWCFPPEGGHEFLWKFQPDWPTLSGVLGWSGILWIPCQLHSMNLHFGLDMNFWKNTLLKFISVVTPVGNNLAFIPQGTQIQPNTIVGKNYNIYFLLKLLWEHYDIINVIIKRPLKRGRLLVSPPVFSPPPPHYCLPWISPLLLGLSKWYLAVVFYRRGKIFWQA